jgi:hypothetical protein
MGTRRAAVTGFTFAALMLGLMPASILAASTPAHQSRARADAAIRFVGAKSDFGNFVDPGRWVGRHVRNRTADGQTISRRLAGAEPRGARYLCEVKITNRGPAGRLTLTEAGKETWPMRYMVNGRDITERVDSGTFRTPRLAHGESFVIRISAKLGRPGTSLMQRLVVGSASNARVHDVVALRLRYLVCGC